MQATGDATVAAAYPIVCVYRSDTILVALGVESAAQLGIWQMSRSSCLVDLSSDFDKE